MLRPNAKRGLVCLTCAILVACGGSGGGASAQPGIGVSSPSSGATPNPVAGAHTASFVSRVTSMTGVTQAVAGTFAGVSYTRTTGTLSGIVDPREAIVGLNQQPLDTNGDVDYTAQFEIIAPATGQPANSVAVVEAENRGNSLSFALLNDVPAAGAPLSSSYPAGLGSAFLERHATSYARVQWQTGIAAGVPANAQGIGLAIVRDFGRFLAGTAATPSGATGISTYRTLILTGVSQSSWFVNDLIAEGFNADPVQHQRVFAGAVAIDGTGNWLALNTLAAQAGAAEQPYLVPSGVPLTTAQLLKRPASDPLYIDVANYTDFYRLRASLTDVIPSGVSAYRYDWPSPHNQSNVPANAAIFSAAGCNGGVPIALNPIGYHPYYRALIIDVETALGAANGPTLPPTSLFSQVPAAAELPDFNTLPGATLTVPAIDANAMPIGGVRFPDADLPLGEPLPPSIPPVSTASIGATCGNYGGFVPFSAAQLASAYGSDAHYAAAYDEKLQALIAAGFVLPEDETGMVMQARALYDAIAGL